MEVDDSLMESLVEDLSAIKTSINKINDALLGGEYNKGKGAIERLGDAERDIATLKRNVAAITAIWTGFIAALTIAYHYITKKPK